MTSTSTSTSTSIANMTWDSIRAQVLETWNKEKLTYLSTLERALYFTLVDHDKGVSGLCATPIVDGCLPGNILHVIMGLYAYSDVEVQVNIGGSCVGKKIALKAHVPTCIYETEEGEPYPLLDTSYHVFSVFDNIADARKHNVWALGMRVGADLQSALNDVTIPGAGTFKNGMLHPVGKEQKENPEIAHLP